jgi:acyl-CoA synthetase (NDP forming)
VIVETVDVEKIRRLLSPRSIALVGATENSFWSRAIIQNLTTLGYTGDVHLIHPTKTEQFGRPCYPSVIDVPGPIDHAYVMTGTQHYLTVLRSCSAKGIHGVTMLTSGFKETGAEGAQRERQLVDFCHEHDIQLIGPNCLGFVNARLPAPAFALLMGEPPRPGHLGVLLASGALVNHVHRLARIRNIGLSYVISSGNEAVLDSADYLRFLVEDPDTTVIAALLEGIRRPAAFIEVAERARSLGKPIVALKTGRSAASVRSAVAHTASLTGADAVVDTLFTQLGIQRVRSVEELVETGAFLQAYGWPPGRRAGIVTPSGGACSVVSDLCSGTAIELPDFGPDTKARLKEILPEFGTPQNPIDTTGVIVLDATLIPRTANVVANDPDLDLLVIVQDPPRDPGPVPSRNDERLRYLKESLTGSPKWACTMQMVAQELTPYGQEVLTAFDLHVGNGLTLGISALDKAIRYGEAHRRFQSKPDRPSLAPARLGHARATDSATRRVLNEAESKNLLRGYGISAPRETLAADAAGAVRAADELGYPVVLKVVAANVPHKTEAGGVALGLRSAGEVSAAYERIVTAVRRYQPAAEIAGVLVAEQVSGVELIAGITTDPLFGPVVVAGLGGIFVEVLQDVAMRLPPFDHDDAQAMVDELRGAAILRGARGRPPADVDALAETLVRLGTLAVERRADLIELDINPLFVLPTGQGVRAADALVVLNE